MNFKEDFSEDQQNLLKKIEHISVENKNYSQDEIKETINNVSSYIMSKSSKNGDLLKELNNYTGILNKLIENEK